jgi:hypothetical protein
MRHCARAVTDLLAGERSSDRKARSYWEVGRQLTGVIPKSRGGKQAAYDKEVEWRLARDMDLRERRLEEMLALFRACPKLPASKALVRSHYRCLLKVSSKRAQAYYVQEVAQHGLSVRQLRIEEKNFELSSGRLRPGSGGSATGAAVGLPGGGRPDRAAPGAATVPAHVSRRGRARAGEGRAGRERQD